MNVTELQEDPVSPVNLTFGIVGSLACVCGILLNALSIPAFYKSIRHISNKFYLMMVITDIVTCLSMIPFCVSRLHNRDSMLYSNTVVCNTAGVLFSLGSQLSVLSVALQSVVRTQGLVFPLRQLKLLPLKIFCLLYFVAQILIAALPFLVGKKYKYYSSVSSCNFSLRERWNSDSLEYKVILMLVGILPFLWPAVPILVSCFISVFILLFRHRTMGNHASNARCQHASVTIVLVTTVHIVLNIPYWNYLLFWLVDFKSAAVWFAANDPHHYLYTFLNPFSMLLNSGINPFIYLIRIRRVRDNILQLCGCKPEHGVRRQSSNISRAVTRNSTCNGVSGVQEAYVPMVRKQSGASGASVGSKVASHEFDGVNHIKHSLKVNNRKESCDTDLSVRGVEELREIETI